MNFKIQLEGNLFEDKNSLQIFSNAFDHAEKAYDADQVLRNLQKNYDLSEEIYDKIGEARTILYDIVKLYE